MKRKIVLGSIVGAILLVSLLGFHLNETAQMEKLVITKCEVFGEKELQYVGELTRTDSFYAEVYDGFDKCIGEAYTYLVDPAESFVNAIFKNGQMETLESGKDSFSVKILDSEAAIKLFQSNMKGLIIGTIDCEVIQSEGQYSITYIVAEKNGGIETGTKACIIVDANTNELLAATFLKATPVSEMVQNVDGLIKIQNAIENGIKEIKRQNTKIADVKVLTESEKLTEKVTTFKGTTYRDIEFNALVTYDDGSTETAFFFVRVNAYTGQVAEIGSSLY